MTTTNPKDRLVPFTSKVAFGIGQFAEGLKNTGFGLFILFYYNQVLELPGTLAGLALFIALVFDAVTDPLAGSLSDNTKSRLGRRHPFMYASALPLALAFLGLFSPPTGLGDWGLFAWLTVFAILTRGAMTPVSRSAPSPRRRVDGELRRTDARGRLSTVFRDPR